MRLWGWSTAMGGRWGRLSGGTVVAVGGIVACLAVACYYHLDRLREQANAAALHEMQRLHPNFDAEEDHPDLQPGNTADALRHCIGSCLAN